MKLRYFIPLLVISAFLMMFLNTVLVSFTTSCSFHFTTEGHGRGNLIISRGFAMFASILVGMLAMPLAAISRKRSSLYGLLLAVLGLIVVINPMNDKALEMLKMLYPEFSVYILSCWLFWFLGSKLREHNGKPQPATAPYGSPAAGSESGEAWRSTNNE